MFEALNKGFGYEGNMTRDGVNCLFPRAVRQLCQEDHYVFTRDMRLYVIISSIQTFTLDVLLDFASNIDCPHLIVRCKRGLDAGSEERREAVQPVLDQYRRSNTRFRLEEVDSTHHAHLTEPECVAAVVNRSAFLTKSHISTRFVKNTGTYLLVLVCLQVPAATDPGLKDERHCCVISTMLGLNRTSTMIHEA